MNNNSLKNNLNSLTTIDQDWVQVDNPLSTSDLFVWKLSRFFVSCFWTLLSPYISFSFYEKHQDYPVLALVPIKDKVSQTFSSRSTLFIEWGTGFISSISLLIYWTLLKAFLFRFIIQLTNKELQLFEITSSDCKLLYLPTNSSNWSVRTLSWSVMFEHFISSYTSSFLESVSNCALVRTIV